MSNPSTSSDIEYKFDPSNEIKNTSCSLSGKSLNSITNTSLAESSKSNDPGSSVSTVPPATASTSNSSQPGSFHVDMSRIAGAEIKDQTSEILQLGLDVFNQDDIEQGVMEQVTEALSEQARDQLKRQLNDVQFEIKTTSIELKTVDKVENAINSSELPQNKSRARKIETLNRQRDNKLKQLKKLKARERSLALKLNESLENQQGEVDEKSMVTLTESLGLPSGETDTEKLIRLGEMTPFGSTIKLPEKKEKNKKPTPRVFLTNEVSEFESFLLTQGNNTLEKRKHITSGKKSNQQKNPDLIKKSSTKISKNQQKDSSNFFDKNDKRHYRPNEKDFSNDLYHNRKVYYPKLKHTFSEDRIKIDMGPSDSDEDAYRPSYESLSEAESDIIGDNVLSPKKGSNNVAWESLESEDSPFKKGAGKKRKKSISPSKRNFIDDAKEKSYEKRIGVWKSEHGLDFDYDNTEQSDVFGDDFKVPSDIWNKLYRYQKTGVKWLHELHLQAVGGIVGDEMGLGKTIQLIAFLAGLRESCISSKSASKKYHGFGPNIIVCPATVMHQWVREFHKWWPLFRVGILHSSGTYSGSESSFISKFVAHRGVVITSYSGLVIHQDILLKHSWRYIILDEGHKIRNPNAQATLVAKQFKTYHRLILSGSPIQNNLKELWSLFDFVFPGKLGTLPDFMANFSVPIVQGGYSNASDVQVQAAYKCACVLRDTINPYLIRRMKADVKTTLDLPSKSEQVLFCRLTDDQRDLYQEYIDSKECNMILTGRFMAFPGLITLRKICNHPDLATGGPKSYLSRDLSDSKDETLGYGYYKRSGKMIVLESLLKLWKKQNNRVLLFSQSKQMLDILEALVQNKNYSYLRMDGGTPISARQPLINNFNDNSETFIFLLTTRVGGLGINLTSANRIIIFDPDWNPSTDMQARERAWRIGQKQEVTIYRLLTTGTIEEKIYHRQIFKQFLCNRVLKDPKQRRFFKSNDLYELFTLGDSNPSNGTETSAIFAGTGSDVVIKPKKKLNLNNTFDKMQYKKEMLPSKKLSNNRHLRFKRKQTIETSHSERVSDSVLNCPIASFASFDKQIRDTMDHLLQSTEALVSSNNVQVGLPEKSSSIHSAQINEITQRLSPNSSSESVAQQGVGSNLDSTHSCITTKPLNYVNNSLDCDQSTSRKYKKHKKKHKKKKKDKKFEGEVIENLDKLHTDNPKNETEKTRDDEYILKKLFKKSGVHSAMQHDRIMMSSDPDYALVEREAEEVAKEAVNALRSSRLQHQHGGTGEPTWTGRSGTVGAPRRARFGKPKSSISKRSSQKFTKPTSAKHFDGAEAGVFEVKSGISNTSTTTPLSSEQLLERMRKRNGRISDSSVRPGSSERINELLTDIRNFVAFQGCIDGQATTRELINKFKTQLLPDETPKFKAMLKQICQLNKDTGIGVWILRPEFR